MIAKVDRELDPNRASIAKRTGSQTEPRTWLNGSSDQSVLWLEPPATHVTFVDPHHLAFDGSVDELKSTMLSR